MGTTKASSDINSLFNSVQKQLELIFEIKVDETEYKERKEFWDKLVYISKKYLKDKKLIILLDSIDQLSEKDYNLKWFFYKLPKNVKIIFTVLKNYKNIFEKLKEKIQHENIIEIKALKKFEAKSILNSYLEAANRKLSHKQNELINKMIDELEDISPLQIKLIFDIVSKWKSSFNIPIEFLKCKTSIDIIKYLFKTIEKEIFDNETLFKSFLFYVTLFEYRGISENELEDILSIDDDVLTSIL